MEPIEVKHTGGMGAFFYGLIPGILGGGALLWLAFVTGCLDLHQQRTIAQRMDNRVGVVEKLQNPVTLLIKQKGCIKISRAYVDGADNTSYESYGGKLTAYVTNSCSATPQYYEWHWEELAPDGTIIQNGGTNQVPVLEPGQTAEVTDKLPDDQRVTKIVVYAGNAKFF